jgi:hypothetical protein
MHTETVLKYVEEQKVKALQRIALSGGRRGALVLETLQVLTYTMRSEIMVELEQVVV